MTILFVFFFRLNIRNNEKIRNKKFSMLTMNHYDSFSRLKMVVKGISTLRYILDFYTKNLQNCIPLPSLGEYVMMYES